MASEKEELTGRRIKPEALKRITGNLDSNVPKGEEETCRALATLLREGHLYAMARPRTCIDRAMAGDRQAMEQFKNQLNRSPALEEYVETHTPAFIGDMAGKYLRRADFIGAAKWYAALGDRGTFRDRFRQYLLPGLVLAQQDLGDGDTGVPVHMPEPGPENEASRWFAAQKDKYDRVELLQAKLHGLEYERLVKELETPGKQESSIRRTVDTIGTVLAILGAVAAVWFLRSWIAAAWKWITPILFGKLLRIPAAGVVAVLLAVTGALLGAFVSGLVCGSLEKKITAIYLDAYRKARQWSAASDTAAQLAAARAETESIPLDTQWNSPDGLHYLYYLARFYNTADPAETIALAADLAAHPENHPHTKAAFAWPRQPLPWLMDLMYGAPEMQEAKQNGTSPELAAHKVAQRICTADKPYAKVLAMYIYEGGWASDPENTLDGRLGRTWDLALPYHTIDPTRFEQYLLRQKEPIKRHPHQWLGNITFDPTVRLVSTFLAKQEKRLETMPPEEKRDFAACMYHFYHIWKELDPRHENEVRWCKLALELQSPVALMNLVWASCDGLPRYMEACLPANGKATGRWLQKSADAVTAAYGTNILSYYEQKRQDDLAHEAYISRQKAIQNDIAAYHGSQLDGKFVGDTGQLVQVLPLTVRQGYNGTVYTKISDSGATAQYRSADGMYVTLALDDMADYGNAIEGSDGRTYTW